MTAGPRRRFRWVAASLLILMALLWGVPASLGGLYRLLVVDQPTDGCDRVMIVSPSPGCLEFAANIVADRGTDQLIVPGGRLRRPERIGALEPHYLLWKRQLLAWGAPEHKVRTVATAAWTPHELFQQLDQQLADGHSGKCQVVTTATLSRYYRLVIDQALPEERAQAYVITAVAPQPADRANWYRNRRDLKRVFDHSLRTLFVSVRGPSEVVKADPFRHLYAALATR